MTEHGESKYPAFMVNRALSYFPDTVLYAVEMNQYPEVDPRVAYDYFYYGIRQKKRYAKWAKRGDEGVLAYVMSHYQYPRDKAVECLKILSDEQLADIIELEKAKEL